MNNSCFCSGTPFVIFTGQDKTLSMKVIDTQGTPLDLTDCTEIKIALPNADGTFTNLLLSMSEVAITTPAILGAFTAPITSIVSALLNVGEIQNIDVAFTISGLITVVRFFQSLTVLEQ